ncbi:MAG: tetratricopeptide repeat protein [Terricaulis sp.]
MSHSPLRLPFALLALSALAACASTGGPAGHRTAENAAPRAPAPASGEARARIGREDMLTQMTFWAQEYSAHPEDIETARRFTEALRLGGRSERAVQIATEALQRHPEDPQLLMTYGLAQIAFKRPQEALRPLALVAQADAQNWRARSALGVALDQLGRFPEARRAYQEALTLRPDDAGVLTNLGVSHLLAGEPEDAEPILRQASALPGAPPEARQNLAIAIALQGRFDEAEQLERIDLPPAAAASNIAYLRGLLSDPRRWGDSQSSLQ